MDAFGRHGLTARDVVAREKGSRIRLNAGGWDADRNGVLEGMQHNTYNVEFNRPNPMCGIYYLGALRAGEGNGSSAREPGPAVPRRPLLPGSDDAD